MGAEVGRFYPGKRVGSIAGATLSAAILALTGSTLPAEAADLARAAREGDLATIENLLAVGTAVNEPENDGSTALLWSVYHGDPEMVSALIDAGADVNAANRLGVAPLLQAARTGDEPILRILLDHGADLSKAALAGETPLMAAARTGSEAAVALLLERGSDPDAVEDYQGQSALMWAAGEGHVGVVRQLLEAGANPDIQARVSELTERSTRTDFPTGGFTAAMFAAREGHEDVLRLLVEGGANLGLTNGDGATAMMIAVINDRFDLAARMVEMGAPTDDGSLYYAALMRDATTDWLAKDGSRWRADYPNELTALDLMRVLLEAGADPNRVFSGQMHSTSMCCDTRENGTPFYRAAVAADVEGLKLMMAHGADVEWTPPAPAGRGGPPAPDMGAPEGGRSPLVAAMNGGKGVGMAGGPGDIRENETAPFREDIDRDPAHAVRALLEGGADPNRPTSGGSTLLHDAARARNLEIIRALADHGAKLDALNGAGLTALDVAEGRRGEGRGGGGGGRGRGFGPPGGPPGAADDGPTNEDVAVLLRELMQAQGVAIVEHGIAGPPAPAAAGGDGA
jgi:ankyrin repeat protein